MKTYKSYILAVLSLLVLQNCVEPFEFSSSIEEQNLVVRAVLTNELKNHTIELSRTIPIDSTKLNPERNAIVSITDDAGGTYSFREKENGVYESFIAFSADANKSYTLNIQTQSGSSYISTPQKLPSSVEIQDINLNIEDNEDEGFKEVVFKVNSVPTPGDGNYYRYEYDETYKVKTVFWNSQKLVVTSSVPPYGFELVDKDPSEGTGICFGSASSKTVMLAETKSLSEDKIVNFQIRKLPLDSYLIGIRYSIMVRQYVLNKNSYDFYTLLDKFSDPDNIFSQIQVGNIPSNIFFKENADINKVIGFFEVSSVRSQRVYFNRKDFTNTDFINYPGDECGEVLNPEILGAAGNSPLLNRLQSGWIFLNITENLDGLGNVPPNTPYDITKRICGDCTDIGPVNAPEFWID
ncbi:DUF4249 domain-containing protein [uncultured Tenacibaculum sp.]|uniref:DUF4249 domain-containing protein n=1 Tax=uncultured Tenacibaculum sp. TaxID=174713 RepID=UPI00261584B1|nr:DUF4249 domain-containing protein [uncultured Tenacibaculum sp.]